MALGAVAAAALVLGTSVPTVTAHGVGSRYEAYGTAMLNGVLYDAYFSFQGQQLDGKGGAWLEIREPITDVPVHALSFEAFEDVSQLTIVDCWYLVEPYALYNSIGPEFFRLGGIKRVCADNAWNISEFTGAYLGLFELDLNVNGLF